MAMLPAMIAITASTTASAVRMRFFRLAGRRFWALAGVPAALIRFSCVFSRPPGVGLSWGWPPELRRSLAGTAGRETYRKLCHRRGHWGPLARRAGHQASLRAAFDMPPRAPLRCAHGERSEEHTSELQS